MDRAPSPASIAQARGRVTANDAEMERLLEEQKRTEGLIHQYERRLNLTPVREQELSDIVRDYNLSKQNYEQLLQKKLQSELATSLELQQQSEQFRILEPSRLPTKPHEPNRLRINLLGGMLGLGLGVGLAFLREIRDGSVYTVKDAERLFRLPLLVSLPELLTAGERRRQRWKQVGAWLGGSFVVLAVVVGWAFVYWRG